jgi:hypothetical protein
MQQPGVKSSSYIVGYAFIMRYRELVIELLNFALMLLGYNIR